MSLLKNPGRFKLAPANLMYDRNARVYVSGSQFVPLYPSTSSSHYLSELLAAEVGLLTAEATFIGWRPPVGFVPSPGRAVLADTLVPLLRAIREGRGVRVQYQSMSRPEPQERRLTPHALAHDGFRWHVRAYCDARAEFRDFVIARMNGVQLDEPSGPGSVGDVAWNTLTELVLIPNPKLTPSHRRALEVDYGMVNGEARIPCREALVFYVLRHLGLHVDLSEQPASQQVVLKDNSQVAKVLAQAPIS